jgi:glycosyltransferase involved in cell wall biosynthesis
MKIIYYSPHPTHDIVSEVGYATHQREVINALKKLGHEVMPVIMGGTDASTLSPLAKDSYKPSALKTILKKLVPKVLWTSFNNYKLLQHDKMAGQRLEKAIVSFKPDLIYERSEYLQDSGAKMASKYNLKYFIEVNAPFVEEMRAFEGYSLYESKAHQAEKNKIKRADKVFVVSSALSDFLVNTYQCKRDKIFIQPNCINPEKITLNPQSVQIIKNNYNLSDKKVIGFVGSMFPYHGVDILINAFSKALKHHTNIKLMIVGDGVIMGDLKTQVASLGIEDDVIFTGKIPHNEVFNYINMMDICIMAKSNWYGSPVKIFEYGLMNKPIIAPNTAPVLDVMVNKVDALIINDNETELSSAIQQLLDDSELSSSLATTFHSKVLELYTWEHAAKNIIEQCA